MNGPLCANTGQVEKPERGGRLSNHTLLDIGLKSLDTKKNKGRFSDQELKHAIKYKIA